MKKLSELNFHNFFPSGKKTVDGKGGMISNIMDEWTIKTPNPTCRLFVKIDLLTDFAALCSTDFIDWRYIHSWLVFSTQLVNCCSHGRRNYIVVYCCPSTFSLVSLKFLCLWATVHVGEPLHLSIAMEEGKNGEAKRAERRTIWGWCSFVYVLKY